MQNYQYFPICILSQFTADFWSTPIVLPAALVFLAKNMAKLIFYRTSSKTDRKKGDKLP